MSENIQSISQGTYTIGNTNELTFSAGPGIKIDQPSEGVVRIGNEIADISNDGATYCGLVNGNKCFEKLYEFSGTVGTSWTTLNFTINEKIGTNNVSNIWINPENSYIRYMNTDPSIIRLPTTYMLGNNRFGSVSVIGTTNGSITYRGIDAGVTDLQFVLSIKYTVSGSNA